MPHNNLWGRHDLPILQKKKTEAPRYGVRHVTSVNSGSRGSSINSSRFQALSLSSSPALPSWHWRSCSSWSSRQDAGAAPREVSQEGKEFASLSEVWSHLCFATCLLHFVRACSHFLCNITPFLTLHFNFPSFLFLIPVALDNGQKWSRGSVSFGCIKSFLHS